MKSRYLLSAVLMLFFASISFAQITINGSGSYANIQAAINASVDGDIIGIPAGTFTESLTISKSLTFIGSGPTSEPTTIITSTASPMISLTATGKDYTFQNLIIHGNVTNLGIRAGGTVDINSLTLQDVIARNCKVAVYLAENWPTGGPFPATVNNLLFNNVTLTNNTHIGAYIGKAVLSGTITNSTITNNGFSDADASSWQKVGLQFVDFSGTVVPSVNVINSVFTNNGSGASSIEKTGLSFYTAFPTFSAVDLLDVSGSTFTDNHWAVRIKNDNNVGNTATINGTFTNNYLDIWFNNVDGTTTSTSLVRRTFTGIRTVGAGPTYDYNTIQSAISAASNGENVNVAAGTYNENVTVNKIINLTGADPQTTFIVGTNGNATPLTISAAGAVVSGFTITHNYTPTELNDWNFNNNGVVFSASSSGSTITNCIVTLNRNGIYLNNSQNNIIDDCVITNNRTGINMTNNFSGTQITDNIISDNWTLGIVTYSLGGATDFSTLNVTGNTFDNNWYSEILIKDAGASTGTLDVTNNTFTDNPVTYSTSDNPDLNEPGFAAQKPDVPGIGGTATKPTEELPTLRIYNSSGVVLKYDDQKTILVEEGQPIEDIIDVAEPNDIIEIDSGTYSAFTINKPITLIGGPGVKINHGSPAITVNATNVTIIGFNFDFDSPDYAIDVLNGAYDVDIYQNRFLNVDGMIIGNGVRNQGSGTVDAINNYWNAFDGPSDDGPGSGNTATNAGLGTLSFAPFYVYSGAQLDFPLDLAVSVPITPNFQWSWPWLGVATYTIEIATDALFTNVVYGPVVAVTSPHQLPLLDALDYNTQYYWRITSDDGVDTYVSEASFTTILGPPSLVSPSNNSINVDPSNVTLEWSPVSGATHYRLTVTGPGAGGPYIVASPSLSYTFGGPLPEGGVYDWYVEVSISGAGGPWSVPSPTWTFTTRYFTSPTHLQSGVSITPLFEWTAPASGSAPYILEISTEPTFALPLVFSQAGINDEFYQLTIGNRLDNATIYYWRVIATGGTTTSGRFSTIFSAIPSLVSPQHLSSIVGNTISFQWTMPAGNLKYILEVDDNPNFLTPAIGFPTTFLTTNVYSHNYTLTTLPANDYYWRVRVYTDTDILISVSSTWRFTISGPPTAIPAYPINLTTVYSNSPIIYWYLNNYYYNQGVYYRVRYGTTMGGPYNGGTSPITTNQWVPLPGLTIGQTYYYVIDASNSNGFGTYTTSEEGSFVVYYSAIAGIPVYQSYPLGNTVYSLTPTLYWFLGVHVPGVAFDIQVNDGPDFTSNLPLEVDVSGVAAYQYKTPLLTAGTSYTWRVRITGSTAWYGPETFYVDPGATPEPSPLDVNIPTPSYPVGGAVVPTQSPVLTWTSSMGSGLEYQVIYSTNPTLDINGVLVNVGPPNSASGGTSGWLITNSHSLSGLTQGVTYYWQVRSRLSNPPNTVSNYSSVAQFTVAPGANPIVVLPANPIVGSTINTTAARLSWIVPAQSEEALTYELEISNDKEMLGTTQIRNLEEPSYELTNLTPGTEYFWRVRSKTSSGSYSEYSYKGEFRTDGGVTGIEEEASNIIPDNYELSQNYPNPFNPTTMISFSLPGTSYVTLKVYDMLGREIRTLLSDYRSIGTHRVEWNGEDNNGSRVTSGTYIYRITADNFSQSKKMILLK